MEPHPPPAPSNDLTAVSTMAESLMQSLRLARALAGRDRPVELDGMQESIGLLCAKALDLAPDDGRTVRVALIALREELDQLSATLRAAAPE